MTEDYGKTWKSLANDLPDFDCLYVVREGEMNPDLLYLGSEMGLRISVDRGQNWMRFRNGFPTVAVHDLLVHPRELDLIIATHGRSIWILDVSGLEGLSQEKLKQDVVLMHPQEVLHLQDFFPQEWPGDHVYFAPNSQPGTRIQYYLKTKPKSLSLVISSADGANRETLSAPSNPGLNVVSWVGLLNDRGAPDGEYRLTLTVDGKEYTTSLRVVGTVPQGRINNPDEDDDGDGK